MTYKRRFVEDSDVFLKLPENEIDKLVRTHMTFKNMLKMVKDLGRLELFTLEDKIKKEFWKRQKLEDENKH